MGEWWRGGVIYQIYPRSFQDSDGDGVGDLPGILTRLDHVASLGVDAIWLSPIFPSPMDDMGYDVSNYTDVDPLFGSLEDFDALIARAHELGLKVIIDQVLSHTSDRHPWFQESRLNRTNARADWYVWVDPRPDGSPPNNWPSVFGGRAWEWNPARRQYYLHNFLTTQPDLNFHNEEVRDAVLDVMRFWLERGVDGFRFDTVNFYFHDARLRDNPPVERQGHMPLAAVNPYDMQAHIYSKSRPETIGFLKRVRRLMNEFPGTATMGEIGDSTRPIELMAEYTAGGDKLNMCYSFEFLGTPFSAAHVRGCIEKLFATGDAWPCWSFSNHDVQRHITRWAGHGANPEAFGRQCAALLLSLEGTVCLYQGEELGLPESDLLFEELTDPPGIRFWPEYKGRDGCRTPMPWKDGPPPNGFTTGTPWLPIKAPQSALNVAAQDTDGASMLNFYRRLIAWRRGHPALVDGDTELLEVAEPVLAYRRTAVSGNVLCVFNLSPEPLSVKLSGVPEDVVPAPISEGATLHQGRLTLDGSGFAYIVEPAGSSIDVRYSG